MKLLLAMLMAFILAETSFAQPQSKASNDIPPTEWTDRTNLGYHGLVHCSLITTQKIAPDPRGSRSDKVGIDPGTSWMCFDTAGWIIENGHEENGKPAGVVKMQRGGDGERLESTEERKQEKKTKRTGDVEITENYVNGDVISREKTEYDAQNRPIRTESYTFRSGEEHPEKAFIAVNTFSYEGTATTTDQQLFNGNEFQRHERWIADECNGRQDSMLFDSEGRLIQEIRLGTTGVEYAWHDPKLKTFDPLDSGWNEAFKQTISASFSPKGEVLKEVEHHNGRYGNVEPDDVEVTDSRGVVVERVEFKYERDAHGNWINRSVLVRDPKTGAMIEVARNHRELTYY